MWVRYAVAIKLSNYHYVTRFSTRTTAAAAAAPQKYINIFGRYSLT
jgi:hypothetical protein